MSPDSDLVKWFALGLALVQTAAAIVQLSLARGRGLPDGPPTPLDRSIRLGLTLLPAAIIILAVVPHLPPKADQIAETTMEALAIIVLLGGPSYVGYVMGYIGAALLRADFSTGSAVANTTALGAGALLLIVCFNAVPPTDDTLLVVVTPAFAAAGFFGGVATYRTANRTEEPEESNDASG